jgi:hypothetical protein
MSDPLDIDRLADALAVRVGDTITDRLTRLIDLSELAGHVAAKLRLDAERLLSRDDLAVRLDVAPRTITAMVARAELPGPILHTAGTARWSWPSVVAWLSARQGKQRRRGRGRWSREKVMTGNGERQP